MQRRTAEQHLVGPGPKRILALDGGGVRGLLTCGVLEEMERTLASRLAPEARDSFRLCDYFDLIGGASTGSIIASLLALGYKASEVKGLYFDLAAEVFGKGQYFGGFTEKFDHRKFAGAIRKAFNDFARSRALPNGHEVLLGDPAVRTGLAIFCKRIEKSSPWIVHNHPHGRFWDPDSPAWGNYFRQYPDKKDFTPNRSFPLSKLIQASASAPFYLKPVEIKVAKDEEGVFIDGGVSPHNNPALEMFRIATARWREPPPGAEGLRSPWGYGWETGADKLMLISVGTGAWRKELPDFTDQAAALKGVNAMRTMIDDSSNLAISWLQGMSEPPAPRYVNFEVEDMRGLRLTPEPLLHFQRIDADLTGKGLARLLGKEVYDEMLKDFRNAGEGALLESLQKLDNSAKTNLNRLETIGAALGTQYFAAKDLAAAILPAIFDPVAEPAAVAAV